MVGADAEHLPFADGAFDVLKQTLSFTEIIGKMSPLVIPSKPRFTSSARVGAVGIEPTTSAL